MRLGSTVTARLATCLAAGTLLLTACGGSSGGEAGQTGSSTPGAASVVASTNVYGDIVKQIAGAAVKITSIISDPTADPHSYEANAQNQLAISKAAIVVKNGGGYDDFVDTMLKSAKNPGARVIDVVDLSGKTAESGQELNEHVWYDFPTMSLLADTLAAALSDALPADSGTFAANAAGFKQKVGQLQATESSIAATSAGAGTAITEPVPLYMLETCGLVNKTPDEFSEAIEEGTDVPARVMQQTLDLFNDKQVKLLAYNEQTSGPETEKVLDAAKANDIAVVPVAETLPSGKDYLSWMSGILSAIQAALS